jgi:hypothetical protein
LDKINPYDILTLIQVDPS